MTVETKYNIGDLVWIIHNNHPIKVKISDLTISGPNQVINYRFVVRKSTTIMDKDVIEYRYEENVFHDIQDIVYKYKDV